MKRLMILVVAVSLPVTAAAAPRVLVVRCGTLIADAAKPPMRNVTIVITDGTVSAVGAASPPPAGAEQLDLRAYTVMPGLVDAHSHLWTGSLTQIVKRPDGLNSK